MARSVTEVTFRQAFLGSKRTAPGDCSGWRLRRNRISTGRTGSSGATKRTGPERGPFSAPVFFRISVQPRASARSATRSSASSTPTLSPPSPCPHTIRRWLWRTTPRAPGSRSTQGLLQVGHQIFSILNAHAQPAVALPSHDPALAMADNSPRAWIQINPRPAPGRPPGPRHPPPPHSAGSGCRPGRSSGAPRGGCWRASCSRGGRRATPRRRGSLRG